MSLEQQRWTLHRVLAFNGAGKSLRWTYELRGGGATTQTWATSKAAAKAAERAWKRGS